MSTPSNTSTISCAAASPQPQQVQTGRRSEAGGVASSAQRSTSDQEACWGEAPLSQALAALGRTGELAVAIVVEHAHEQRDLFGRQTAHAGRDEVRVHRCRDRVRRRLGRRASDNKRRGGGGVTCGGCARGGSKQPEDCEKSRHAVGVRFVGVSRRESRRSSTARTCSVDPPPQLSKLAPPLVDRGPACVRRSAALSRARAYRHRAARPTVGRAV